MSFILSLGIVIVSLYVVVKASGAYNDWVDKNTMNYD